MTPPSADSVIGTTSSLSSLIVENFLSLNRLTGNENCRIAGICGQYNEEYSFIPEVIGQEFIDLVDQNNLFLFISVNQAEDVYVITGWSEKDFNKTATEPLSFILEYQKVRIRVSSINPRMELFIDRIIN